jgi:uncharacterized protein
MAQNLVQDFIIPAGYARAFTVNKGQVIRIYLPEGKQVGDCVFYNAHDYKETFHAGQTWALNMQLKTGNAKSYKYFYSKPPRENVMLSVVEDTVKDHWGNQGGRCTARLYALRDGDTGHRNCQDNLAEALAEYGISSDDIMDVFNVFMNVKMDAEGNYSLEPTKADTGDHIDLLAEMDILAAVSACPSDNTPINGYVPKPLGIQIFE